MTPANDGIRELMAAVLYQAVYDVTMKKPEWEPPTEDYYRETVLPKYGDRSSSYEEFLTNRERNYRAAVNRWTRLRWDALRWMQSNQKDYIFSFLSICEQLDLDPVGVRRRMGVQ